MSRPLLIASLLAASGCASTQQVHVPTSTPPQTLRRIARAVTAMPQFDGMRGRMWRSNGAIELELVRTHPDETGGRDVIRLRVELRGGGGVAKSQSWHEDPAGRRSQTDHTLAMEADMLALLERSS